MHFSVPLFLNWHNSDGGRLQLKALLVGFGEELSGELVQIFIDLLQGPDLLLQFRHTYLSVLPIAKHTLTRPQRERVMTSFWQTQEFWHFWPMTLHFLHMLFPVIHDNTGEFLFIIQTFIRMWCTKSSEWINLNKHCTNVSNNTLYWRGLRRPLKDFKMLSANTPCAKLCHVTLACVWNHNRVQTDHPYLDSQLLVHFKCQELCRSFKLHPQYIMSRLLCLIVPRIHLVLKQSSRFLLAYLKRWFILTC